MRLEGRQRPGYSLTELVVVIAIVAVLLALVLAGVQSARQSAARVSCQNALRQMALAWESHVAAQGYYPTSGYDYDLPVTFTAPGSPAVGGPRWQDQTAGWMYQVLPWLDQEPLWRQAGVANRWAANARVLGTPVPTYFCPLRPAPRAWQPPPQPRPEDNWPVYAGYDYCANTSVMNYRPARYTERLGSVVRPNQLSGGLSNTILLGERRIPVNEYRAPSGYNSSSYAQPLAGAVGNAFDKFLNHCPPVSDRVTDEATQDLYMTGTFGSGHPTAINAALGDGSVRAVRYTIDPDLWWWLCTHRGERPPVSDF